MILVLQLTILVYLFLPLSLSIDSLDKMKAALPALRKKMKQDPDYFKKPYLLAFEFSKAGGARTIAVDAGESPDTNDAREEFPARIRESKADSIAHVQLSLYGKLSSDPLWNPIPLLSLTSKVTVDRLCLNSPKRNWIFGYSFKQRRGKP